MLASQLPARAPVQFPAPSRADNSQAHMLLLRRKVARAAHTAQNLPDRGVRAVEARQFRDGEDALAIAPRSQAVDRQEKARQLM